MKYASNYAMAGKLIRQFLKASNIDGKVSGQGYAGGSSIRVHVVDLKPAQAKLVEDFAKQFEYGSFDGMEDIYRYDNVNKELPQVSHVFINNVVSPSLSQSIWDFARARYAGLESAPADYKEAYNFYVADSNMYASSYIFRLFAGGYQWNDFWDYLDKKAA